ncbi:cytochrome P450 [Mycolicibacterium pyrenivorans]|uniref:cytochrome P450 n=1 Tax=Mycolicibacterium pyrenivorans TaxID=187102 RepID=UPI0021F29C42|nr:cytochrome P450 [Mycolicibacterium pyrenivorans]
MALFADESLQNPYPLYRRMLDHGPVHPVGDSGFFAVCSWDAVNDAVARPEDFSSNLTGTMTYHPDGTVGLFPMDELGGPTQVLAIADDPAHAVHRKKLVPQLAAKRIRALESFVAAATASLWRDEVQDNRVEWMSAVANRLPMMVVCRLIGVPDEDADRLAAWGYASTQLLEGLVGQEQLAAAGTAAMELAAYVATKFAQEDGNPRDTLLGDLATACATGELDVMTAQMMMITLFGAGGESTASLIGSATSILATRPQVQRQLRENPGLIPVFLEEVLRFEPPFRGHYRHVLRDCTLAGHDLPGGSRLILLWGAANRDPAHFESPDELRLDRANGKGHIAFGRGAHFCVGAALARMEARIVLEHLLSQTTRIEVVETGRWLPSLLVRRLERLVLAVH